MPSRGWLPGRGLRCRARWTGIFSTAVIGIFEQGGWSCNTALIVKSPAAPPMLFEQALHGVAHALVVENHGGPTRPRDYRVEQRNHAVLAVKQCQLHR